MSIHRAARVSCDILPRFSDTSRGSETDATSHSIFPFPAIACPGEYHGTKRKKERFGQWAAADPSRTDQRILSSPSTSAHSFDLIVELCYMNPPIATLTAIDQVIWVRYSRKTSRSWNSQSRFRKRLQDSFNQANIVTFWISSTLSARMASVTSKIYLIIISNFQANPAI
jgi:hypothetical protein